MTVYTNRAGQDVDLAITPDTPRTWDRNARLVAAVDRLTAHLPAEGWELHISLPDNTAITAVPATIKETAA